MLAVVGQAAPFEHGRQQMKSRAGLAVASKAVERTAESIGEDIAAREQRQIQRSMQLDLPMVRGESVPMFHVLMDGTGVPVVKKETAGRAGKKAGEPAHAREAKLGCVFTQTKWDTEGYPIRDPDSTTYAGAIETAEEFGKRLYLEAWNRGWSRAEKKVVIGEGAEWIGNIAQQHFPGAIGLPISFTLANTCGIWHASCSHWTRPGGSAGSPPGGTSSTRARLRNWPESAGCPTWAAFARIGCPW
jgi:hypothetical protein